MHYKRAEMAPIDALFLTAAVLLATAAPGQAGGDIFSAVSADSQAKIKQALVDGEDINQKQPGARSPFHPARRAPFNHPVLPGVR